MPIRQYDKKSIIPEDALVTWLSIMDHEVSNSPEVVNHVVLEIGLDIQLSKKVSVELKGSARSPNSSLYSYGSYTQSLINLSHPL